MGLTAGVWNDLNRGRCSGGEATGTIGTGGSRHSGLCRGCRTYLIRGFGINGRRITRAREFCDDACKMRAERRKSRMAGEVPCATKRP
jgi:hypothetical protein